MWFYISRSNFNAIGLVLTEIWCFEISPHVRDREFFDIRHFFVTLTLGRFLPKVGQLLTFSICTCRKKMEIIYLKHCRLYWVIKFDKIENWCIRWGYSDARSAKVILTRNERTMCIACAKVICPFWTKPEVSSMSGSKVMVKTIFFTFFVTLTLTFDLSE